jgi:23S rRNA (cytidine2498-2'-O)-methyltransferase
LPNSAFPDIAALLTGAPYLTRPRLTAASGSFRTMRRGSRPVVSRIEDKAAASTGGAAAGLSRNAIDAGSSLSPFASSMSNLLTAYLAAEGFIEPLLEELTLAGVAPIEVNDRLIMAPGPALPVAWAQNIWRNAERIPIESIKDAAKALRSRQRNWALWPIGNHRRAQLIQEALPHVGAKPLAFPAPAPSAPLGSWTLLDRDTILVAAECSSPFRHGEVAFVEDRTTPPNRAYLKLWEALTVAGRYPVPGERCLDLGASPGGWSWVLQTTGADVVSVDRAPLDPRIAALPRIEHRQASAFALSPESVGPVDWLTSDVICYPTRLLRLVHGWLDSGLARNFICSVKFQGPTDHDTARAFAAIPGSRLVHLFHNKHELTWIRLAELPPSDQT